MMLKQYKTWLADLVCKTPYMLSYACSRCLANCMWWRLSWSPCWSTPPGVFPYVCLPYSSWCLPRSSSWVSSSWLQSWFLYLIILFWCGLKCCGKLICGGFTEWWRTMCVGCTCLLQQQAVMRTVTLYTGSTMPGVLTTHQWLLPCTDVWVVCLHALLRWTKIFALVRILKIGIILLMIINSDPLYFWLPLGISFGFVCLCFWCLHEMKKRRKRRMKISLVIFRNFLCLIYIL
jgi:hypothetical protein